MNDTMGPVSGQPDPIDIQDAEQFAQALSSLREASGQSIRQVARLSGVPSATLGGYFSGRHLPPATQLSVLDATLGALGVTDPGEQQTWHEALRRVRRASGKRPASATTAPYRGLEPFTEDDAGLFFGREAVVAQLQVRVAELGQSAGPRMLTLVGPSGSGKSSVLRAGLVSGLRQRASVTVMVPGADPVDSLARALADSPEVLVIDQAEEIFSPEVDPQARHEFIARVSQLAVSCVVLLALRADFYGQAASEPLLVPALRDSQILLGAMSLQDLSNSVLLPAQAVGVGVDQGLLDLLLRDLTGGRPGSFSYDAGALPLVSHALLSTWRHHDGPSLTANDYLAVGGLNGAVKQSAEAVYSSFDAAGRTAAQWLFGQLVLLDPDGAMTRRRVEHDTLHHPDPDTDAALDAVIEAFVAGRLLTAQESTIEISHEALLTAWPRLHEWVLSDLDAARLQSRIAESARVWDEGGHDPDLLLRGGPLLDAQALTQNPVSPRVLTASERDFVHASSAQQAAADDLEKRRKNRLRTIVAVTTVLAVVATTLAGLAYWSRVEANTQRAEAVQAREDALSAQLGIAANTVRPRDPAAAAQLALAGYRMAPTLTARSALLDSTGVPTPFRFVGPDGDMHAAATTDGGLIASSGQDGVTRLWLRSADGAYQRLPDLPAAEWESPGPVYASGFSPDDRTLVVADVGDTRSTVQFWDLADPSQPVLRGTRTVDGAVLSMAFTPDGSRVLVGTGHGIVASWSLAPEIARLSSVKGFEDQVVSLSYGTDNRFAVGTDTGSIVIVDGSDRQRVRVPGGSSVNGVAFSPDGRTLASGQKDGNIRIWQVPRNIRPEQQGAAFGDFQSWVNAVTFSEDASLLAAASSDGHIKVFSMPTRAQIGDLPSPAFATSVQFVDDAAGLLTSEGSGTAKLWPLPLPAIPGFGDAIWSLHLDSSNRTLLVGPGAGDGGLYVYGLNDRSEPSLVQVLRSEQAGATDGSSDISEDGSWVAGGTGGGKVAVWERRGDRYRPAGVATAGTTIVENVAITGSLMAAVDDGKVLSLWNLREGQEPEKFSESPTGAGGLAVGISPNGALVAAGFDDDSVRLWTVDGSQVSEGPVLKEFTNDVNTVAFDPSGRYLAAGANDHTVRVWDVSDPNAPVLVGEPLKGPSAPVYGVAWSGDGSRLAAGSKDGSAWVWNMTEVAAPEAIATLHGPGADILSVAFGQGNVLFGGGVDNMVIRWHTDVETVAAHTCAATGEGLGPVEWSRLMPSMPLQPTC